MASIAFTSLLTGLGLNFFTGVPDSALRGFCRAVNLLEGIEHFPAANEGAAVALGIGHYLTTGKPPVVYLQNSGLWNALNPFFSLAHRSVYDIPILFLVGWRGQPGCEDEPQHGSTGAVTESALEMMGVRPFVLSNWDDALAEAAHRYVAAAVSGRRSAAFLVSRGVFDEQNIPEREAVSVADAPKRRDIISTVMKHVTPVDLVVSGIGHTSRELYGIRIDDAAGKENLLADFLCVGGMGYAHQVSIGAALSRSSGCVWCLDGDGSFLMHMGAAAAVSMRPDLPFIYVLIDNGTHASVGGQPIACHSLDYCAVARAVGFRHAERVESPSGMDELIPRLLTIGGPRFVWVPIRNEPDLQLPRPTEELVERKKVIMNRHGA